MKSAWKSLLLSLNLIISSGGTVLAETTAPPPVQETPTPSATANPEKTPTTNKEAEPSPEEIARYQKLLEADKLYLEGNKAAAEKIYRQVKAPFTATSEPEQRPEAIVDPAQLPPAGRVYWREAQAGMSQKLETRTLVPLRLLVEQYPQFIQGHIKLAEALKLFAGEGEARTARSQAALQILERATTMYPDQADLVKAKITALADANKWMEASLAARQYSILYAERPEAQEFAQLAEQYLKRYKQYVRREMRGNAIANIITGAIGYAVTGSLFGPFSALDSTLLLLRGEEAVGESVTKQAKRQLKLVEDKEVVGYVNELGQKLAKVAGRNDFKYEFYVVLDENLNAFALPGGKIFVNAGALVKTNSEAELAGLLAHEISHSVLSHGFQLVTQGNLLANLTQYLPLGGTVANLFTLNYSRDMERQSDTLGTRILASSGYAADGLRNLMITLDKQAKNSLPSWISSHPATGERIRYLESLIQQNRYNRYAFEGVGRHGEIRALVKKILQEKKEREEKKKQPREQPEQGEQQNNSPPLSR
ncbi:MAG: M48 family metallopeptidase [Nostocaceae cyanobacterium]|nr:M48 family metallopeptidase [Nostocaceae cyanobacterium]